MTPDRTAPDASPELLAPAGDFAALRAAVGNGADAVYLGGARFSARRGAPNFDPGSLREAIDYAHLRSAKVYLALNTLIADDEGDAALALAAQAYAAGIDAIIVQDVGLAIILKQLLPELQLHASTQMNLFDRAGILAAARMGMARVILPRELSLDEIRELTGLARANGLETEVFIHGALCVGYSGQCLISSLGSGRSGNRGECAQPCRLPWRRHGPGLPSEVKAEKAYPWLSPRDQALLNYLPGLIEAGVSSLKIEGRMRGSAYVGQVVSVYRAALDGKIPADAERRLLLAFNRGGAFTSRCAAVRRDDFFLSGEYPGSHGIHLGDIVRISPRTGHFSLMTAPGWPVDFLPGRRDILSIRRAGEDSETASAPIGQIEAKGRLLEIKGFHPEVLATLAEGDPVYLMTNRQAENSQLRADRRRTPLAVRCAGSAARVTLEAEVLSGPARQGKIRAALVAAAEAVNPLTPARVEEQIRKSGGTPFEIASIEIDGPISLSIAALNSLRRNLFDELAAVLAAGAHRQLPGNFAADWQRAAASLPPRNAGRTDAGPAVSVYYHRLPDPGEAIACGADRYLLPLLELTKQRADDLVGQIRANEPEAIVLAWIPAAMSGRSRQLGETILPWLSQRWFNGIDAGHPGLDMLAEPTLLRSAGQPANIFNQATLCWYAAAGAVWASPSPELDESRLLPLRQKAAKLGLLLELPLYGRLRLMTSEYCVIGQNSPGCSRCRPGEHEGRPASIWHLQDRRGQIHPVLTNPRACTSELLSNFILSAAPELVRLAEAAPSDNDLPFANLAVRLAFCEETPAERRQLVEACRRLILADSRTRLARAGEFQDKARRIAARLETGIGSGHYRQGV